MGSARRAWYKRNMPFFSLIRPYRNGIALALVCLFLTNILALFLPWGIKLIIDDVLREGNVRLLHGILWCLLGILAARTALNFLQKYMSSIIGEKIVADLRRRLFDHVQRLPLVRVQALTPSQLLSRISGDVDSIRRFIFGDALDFIYAVFGVAGILVLLVLINARLTMISVMILPFFAVFYFGLLPRLKDRYSRMRDAYGLLMSRINEVLSGMTTVRAFGAEAYEKVRFDRRQKDIFRIAGGTHALNTGMWIAVEMFSSLGVLAVLWAGGEAVIGGRMTAGSLVAFYSYLGMLFAPLIRMAVINSSFQEASAAIQRINEVLSIGEGLPATASVVSRVPVSGAVVFEGVSFGYVPDRRVIEDVSFCVKPGETVGIIGASGVGKSTLVGLVLRFFDPDQGRILIDGRDLRSLDRNEYCRRVAVVLQDDFLFQDSVLENIRYADPGISLAQVRAAARLCLADEFIEALPQGYDTLVGERGSRLSCGQRQRIAIARALVRSPAILVLDEATSSVDAMTENAIQKAVKASAKDRTVFVVAHRFSTIMEADKIVVLESGRVNAVGSHEALLSRCSFYRHLYQEQFKGSGECG